MSDANRFGRVGARIHPVDHPSFAADVADVQRAWAEIDHPLRVESLSFGLLDFVAAHRGAIPAAAIGLEDPFEHPLVRRAKLAIAAACRGFGKTPSHCVVTEFRKLDAIAEAATCASREFGCTRMGASTRTRSSPSSMPSRPARPRSSRPSNSSMTPKMTPMVCAVRPPGIATPCTTVPVAAVSGRCWSEPAAPASGNRPRFSCTSSSRQRCVEIPRNTAPEWAVSFAHRTRALAATIMAPSLAPHSP